MTTSFASRCRLRFPVSYVSFFGVWIHHAQIEAWRKLLPSKWKPNTHRTADFFYPLLSVSKSAALRCLAGAEKMLLMNFPLHAIDVGSVNDRVTLACLGFQKNSLNIIKHWSPMMPATHPRHSAKWLAIQCTWGQLAWLYVVWWRPVKKMGIAGCQLAGGQHWWWLMAASLLVAIFGWGVDGCQLAGGHLWVVVDGCQLAGGHLWVMVDGCQLAGGHLWVGVDGCQLAGGHLWVVVDGCQLAGGHLWVVVDGCQLAGGHLWVVVDGCQLAGGHLWVVVDGCQLAGGHLWVVVDGCQLAGGHLWVGVDGCQLAGGHLWVVGWWPALVGVDGCQVAGGQLWVGVDGFDGYLCLREFHWLDPHGCWVSRPLIGRNWWLQRIARLTFSQLFPLFSH